MGLVGLCLAACLLGSGSPASAVTGGTEVDAATFASDWSFTVAVGNSAGVVCTGSLVNASTVITAGHCVDPAEVGTLPDTVFYGNPDYTKASTVGIESIDQNPDYGGPGQGDTAILNLAQPVTGVTPIRVATLAEAQALGASVSARFAGWGYIDNSGIPPTTLHAGAATVTSNTGTGSALWSLPEGTVMDCQGDSGGPLVATVPSGEDVLIGATSFGGQSCPSFVNWTDLGRDSFIQNALNPGEGGLAATLVKQVSPTSGSAPLTVTFNLSWSSISDGSPASYLVDPTFALPPGCDPKTDPSCTSGVRPSANVIVSSNPVIQFTYTQAGTYTALIVVYDANSPDVAALDSVTITVGGSPPPAILVYSVSPTTGPAPLTVSFDLTGSRISDGSSATYFVDPTSALPPGCDPNDPLCAEAVTPSANAITSSNPMIQFTYTQAGTYTALISVSDPNSPGVAALASVKITVGESPPPPPPTTTAILVASVSPTSGPAPLTVSFDLTGSQISDGSPATYLVDPTYDPNSFPSPNLTASTTPIVTTFTYTQPGTYTALVVVQSADFDPNNPIYDQKLVTITVTAPPAKADQSITFNSISDRTYGAADFDPGATASSRLAVSYTADGDCSIVNSKVHVISVGSCTVTASQGGDSNYSAAPSVQQTFAIDPAGTTTSVSVAAKSLNPTAQFSDTVALSATVSADASALGDDHFSGTLSFQVNGHPSPALTRAVSDSSATQSVDVRLDNTLIPNGAGSYDVTATFTPASGGNYAGSSKTVSEAVSAEGQNGDGSLDSSTSLDYNGDQYVTVGSAPNLLGTLSQSMAPEATDGEYVDFSTSDVYVVFDIYPASCGSACTTSPIWSSGNIKVANRSDWASNGTGYAQVTGPKTLSADSYLVTVSLVANGYIVAEQDTSTLDVAPVSGTFITGAGSISPDSTANTGSKHGRFTFNIAYNKNGPRGSAAYTYRMRMDTAASSATNIVPCTTLGGTCTGVAITIRSNALSALYTGTMSKYPMTGFATGKMSVQFVDTVTGLHLTQFEFGGGSFRLDLTDDASGGATDTFGFTAYRKDGTLFHQASIPASGALPQNGTGSPTNQKTITGGNLTVHPE
jgi:hypothetical protein